MNKLIPVITRRLDPAGNPGDAFICLGLQWLISQVIKSPKFLFIDKFVPDDFKRYQELIKEAGQLIYAGTPQYNNLDDWCLWYDWKMYVDHIAPLRIAFHSIAGGSGYPSTNMTPIEFSKYCLTNDRTRKALEYKKQLTQFCTARDLHTYQLLSDLGQQVSLLPCTALWSSYWLGIKSTVSKTIGLVAPSHANVVPSLVGCTTADETTKWFGTYFLKLSSHLRGLGYSTVLVCHGIKEYQAYKDLAIDVFYSNDLVSLMQLYGQLHGVISGRLHGAIPVAGMNKRALLIGVDTRHTAADVIGIPKLLLGVDKIIPEQVISKYFESSDDYTSIMESSRQAYIRLFQENIWPEL